MIFSFIFKLLCLSLIHILVQTGSSDSNIANCDGEFLCLWYSVSDVSSMKTTGTRYKLTHTTDISYEITYADNGAVVELPCFQAVSYTHL